MDISWVHVSDLSLALNTNSWQKATEAPEPVLKKKKKRWNMFNYKGGAHSQVQILQSMIPVIK